MTGIKGKSGVYNHKPHSKETKKKIGMSNSVKLKGKPSNKKGKTYLEMYGKEKANKLSKEHSTKMIQFLKSHPEKHPNYICGQKQFVSKPQLELYLIIKKYYMDAELEYPIKTKHSIRFADIAIPSLKLDIEYDGQHWHINKTEYLDKLRDNQLIEVGWKTIRINENNIKTELNKIIDLK